MVWLHGEIKTPPFPKEARLEAGYLLRRLQAGHKLSLPNSRPLPVIGTRCHELRIQDAPTSWRIVYRTDSDAVVILDVFKKTTPRTPTQVLARCQRRLRNYDE